MKIPSRRSTNLSFLALIAALTGATVLAACASGTPQPEAAPEAEPTPGAAAPGVEAEPAGEPAPVASATPAPLASSEPAPVAPPAPAYPKFDDMKPAERMEHMKTVVMPKMKSLFQEFDAKEFANFSCATCHGKGAKNGNFKMPNASLPKLDVSDHFAKEAKAHPEMMKFMGEKVVPEMASLLGEERYNPETQKGFGCFGCHTMK